MPAYPNPYERERYNIGAGFGSPPPVIPAPPPTVMGQNAAGSAPAGGYTSTKAKSTAPTWAVGGPPEAQAKYMAAAGGKKAHPASTPAVVAASTAGAPRAARPAAGGPLTGDALIGNVLEGALRGTDTSFSPQVMEQGVTSALGMRSADMAGGRGDVERNLAASGLGRSPAGQALLAESGRSAAGDFSKRVGNLYSQKAQQDFADKMGAVGPYSGLMARKSAEQARSASLAEQARQFDLSRADEAARRGHGGGGDSQGQDDQALLQTLMGSNLF